MHTTDQPPTQSGLGDIIPSTDTIRRRLAVATTEAGLLRALLRLARRHEHEARRLERLYEGEVGHAPR